MLQIRATYPHSAETPGRRLRILMICAHEPTLDPRVRWEAESSAERFETTVLGFNNDDGSKPALEEINGYRIVRLPRRAFDVMQFFLRLKDVLPFPVLALVALSPFIMIGELLLRIARPTLRFGRKVSRAMRGRTNGSYSTVTEVRRAQWLRDRVVARLVYIVVVLRARFAPAAVLFWNYLLAMHEKPDVVHCNDLDTLVIGVLAKKRFCCHLIYDAHEFFPVSDPRGSWVEVKFFAFIEGLLIRHADAVVTVNPMLAELMRRSYALEAVHAVANAEPWVEHRQQTVSKTPMTARADGRLKFLFQGRFAPERGIEEIIKAWSMVDGDKAVLFLRGPESIWREAAIDLARRLGVLDRGVFFLEAVTEDQLVEAAAGADVGIVPYKPGVINDQFSCPNKLSQYLHAGLMVVANDLPYVKSVIEEAQAGLCYNSIDLSTLVAIVDRLANEPELLWRCRANALKFARERFNWQAQGGLFHSLYTAAVPAAEMAAPILQP